MEAWLALIFSIVGSFFYALIWYAKTWATTNPPEPFSYTKFAATLIVGGAIGVIFWLSGSPETQENFVDQIVAYGAVTAVVETILKAVLGKLGVKYPGSVKTILAIP